MIYTARKPWDTPNPNTLPPALHNARYEGWPKPPLQLPSVAPPSFKNPAERRVTFAIDPPSHNPRDGNATHARAHPAHLQHDTHPRTYFGAQDITCPVESRRHNVPTNSWVWNCGTCQIPSLQGTFEMRTTARHDKENGIRHDPARGTKNPMPLNAKETQIAYLLATPCVPLIYDLRYPPTSLHFPASSPYAGRGYELLRVPLTPTRPKHIRLISPNFPWAFDIVPDPSAGADGVTCLEVLTTLHAALQRPLTDTEWGSAGKDKHASLLRACDRRLNMSPALCGSSVRSTVRFASDANAWPARREPVLLRVDWLGSCVAFGGLFKDDAFAKKRLIPGAREPPETWVVKFQRLL